MNARSSEPEQRIPQFLPEQRGRGGARDRQLR